MSISNDDIEKYREILERYDSGMSSLAGCLSDLHSIAINELLDALEKRKECITFSSCCCLSHPPDRKFTAEFTITPHGFKAKRVD